MATAPPPSKPKKPPPAKGTPPPANSTPAAKDFKIQTGRTLTHHKTVIYGPGGVGKSELCSLLSEVGITPLFIDLDNETGHLDVARIEIDSWNDLRAVLLDTALLEPFGAVVIDSFTKAEEMASAWVLANIKYSVDKPRTVENIEDYGWGKGFTHIYGTFLKLLQDLDKVFRTGKHIICTAHDCTDVVSNAMGDDWIQIAPRLQHSGKGKASIRLKVREWATHLLYVGYDTSVSKGEKDKAGKGKGVGTRTIYSKELPGYLAKSRTPFDPIPYLQGDATLWRQLLGIEE